MTEQAPAALAEIQARTGHRYSIARAVRSALARSSQPYRPDGLEGEVSAEIAARTGKDPLGFYMPLDVEVGSRLAAAVPERRADTTSTGSGAAATVWPPRLFLDVLRAKLVVEALGGRITTLSTERGQVKLPVQTAATPVTWVAENANAGATTGLTVSSVTFVPHTALCNTGISRFMDELGAPGFDDWIYADLAKQIAVNIDAVAIQGGGTNQPSGILATGGIPTYTLAADAGNGGAPAYADLVGIEEALANSNGDSRADARLGWLTSPNGRSKLRRTDTSALVSGASGQWAWSKDFDTVLGRPAFATTNVPNNLTKGTGTNLTALIYGDWQNLIINLFSAVDILVNPFTIATLGYYQVNAYQEADVQVARTAGFRVANAMVTT